MSYIAMTNFRYKGKDIKKNEVFDIDGLSKYKIRSLIDWRKIKKVKNIDENGPTNTINTDNFNTIEDELNVEEQNTEKEQTREELEKIYNSLGGRARSDWTDKELQERIAKKQQQE
jgi:squalene cyclase